MHPILQPVQRFSKQRGDRLPCFLGQRGETVLVCRCEIKGCHIYAATIPRKCWGGKGGATHEQGKRIANVTPSKG